MRQHLGMSKKQARETPTDDGQRNSAYCLPYAGRLHLLEKGWTRPDCSECRLCICATQVDHLVGPSEADPAGGPGANDGVVYHAAH